MNYEKDFRMNEHQILRKSAQSVQDVLASQGLECTVVEFPASTRTAAEAATAIGCDVAQIVKSLIFKTKETGQAVLVLASGSDRVDEKIIETLVGEKITKAAADFVRDITGFAIGGVPPIGHKQRIPFIFVDEDLLKFDSVWAAAGTPNAVFNLRSVDMPRVTDGKIVKITG